MRHGDLSKEVIVVHVDYANKISIERWLKSIFPASKRHRLIEPAMKQSLLLEGFYDKDVAKFWHIRWLLREEFLCSWNLKTISWRTISKGKDEILEIITASQLIIFAFYFFMIPC